jgi:hypothetical protein
MDKEVVEKNADIGMLKTDHSDVRADALGYNG